VAYGQLARLDRLPSTLKHDSFPRVPFDFVKDLRKNYKREIEFEALIREWLVKLSQES